MAPSNLAASSDDEATEGQPPEGSTGTIENAALLERVPPGLQRDRMRDHLQGEAVSEKAAPGLRRCEARKRVARDRARLRDHRSRVTAIRAETKCLVGIAQFARRHAATRRPTPRRQRPGTRRVVRVAGSSRDGPSDEPPPGRAAKPRHISHAVAAFLAEVVR